VLGSRSPPGVGAGGNGQQRRGAGLRLEAGKGRRAGPGAHPAAQHDRVVRSVPEGCGEPVEVAGPLGEYQAVPSPGQCLGDVIGDLGGSAVVGDQVPVDRRHAARRGRLGVSGVAESGGMHAEDGRRPGDGRGSG
jgi:hypothetical protein